MIQVGVLRLGKRGTVCLISESLSPEKMGITQVCVSCHKYRQTFICLILFAIVFTAQGRAISSFIKVAQKKDMKEGEPIMVAKPQIGSRPPKCEKRCSTCEHCEAVQVPVVPQIERSHTRHYYSSARATRAFTYSSRGDDLSNYKPMSWKCNVGPDTVA
ncbi:EPIDERMAL PATTERNING FACTOR-like protein 2, partial [Mucuna pruriens]